MMQMFWINKPLKDPIKRQYESYRNSISKTFVPGDQIKITREVLTRFIIDSYDQINEENMTNCYIRRGFDQCGLNPYVADDSIFKQHLKSLTLTAAYRALIDKNKAVDAPIDS